MGVRGILFIVTHDTVDDWWDYAACYGQDTNLFYPTKHLKATEAKAVCARCPVTTQCLDYALQRNDQNGVWGGLSVEERKEYRREWKRNNRRETA